MSATEFSAEQIRIIFAKRSRRFYLLNIVAIGLTLAILSVFRDHPQYPIIFGITIVAFLLWLFNADRFCLCPACEQVPRGAGGLIVKPKQCVKCGVALI